MHIQRLIIFYFICFLQGKSKHGDLHKFLSGDEKFHVPILSIYGDSGDTNVMDFLRKPDSLGNFLMLHEKCSQRIGAVRFFGLGGRFIPSKVFDAGTIDVDTFSGDRTKLVCAWFILNGSINYSRYFHYYFGCYFCLLF